MGSCLAAQRGDQNGQADVANFHGRDTGLASSGPFAEIFECGLWPSSSDRQTRRSDCPTNLGSGGRILALLYLLICFDQLTSIGVT
jgi:hypothetical protein